MTPFMVRVVELLDGKIATPPAIVASRPKPWDVGLVEHAVLRLLAGQLVTEANVVLGASDERLLLEDHLGENMLGFTLRFANRQMHISTHRVNGFTLVRFDGWGSRCSQQVELESAKALEDAVLRAQKHSRTLYCCW